MRAAQSVVFGSRGRDAVGVGAKSVGRVIDLLVGGLVGLVIGWVAALNLVIYAGTERGYETSLATVFDHQPFVGVAAVALLVAGPVVGVAIARRTRFRRQARRRAVAKHDLEGRTRTRHH